MSFYTCVNRYGNNMLYRGYDDQGKAVKARLPFEPTMYLVSQKATGEWKTLQGQPVEPIKLDSMSEASDFVKKYKDIDNFQVHGNSNFTAQFLNSKHPGKIDYDSKLINVGNIDIEVQSDDGFPEPDQAKYPVTAICYKSSQLNAYYVWGTGDYDVSKTELELDGAEVLYVKCAGETDLMLKFLNYWMHNCPDIITGWNIRLFDIPYLIKRTENILGKETVKKFSPFGITKYRQIAIKGRDMDAYEIYGVQQVDYYDLFTKFGFTYGTQASYSLDHIASTVLGEKKLSYAEHGSLFGLYKSNHQKFIDYNIKDVQLVDKIDKQTGLMDLALVIAYKGGVNYADTFGTTGIWDSIIYRYLSDRNIAVPPSVAKRKDSYPGGYVKEPRVGMTEWVTSFDLNSLYPNLIVQYNMSPETLLNGGGDFTIGGVDHYLNNELTEDARAMDVAVAANGSMYRKDKRGMLPSIILDLYSERRDTKNHMLEVKKEIELLNAELTELKAS